MGVFGVVKSLASSLAGAIKEERKKKEEREEAFEEAVANAKAQIIAAKKAEEEMKRKEEQERAMDELLGLKKAVRAADAPAGSGVSVHEQAQQPTALVDGGEASRQAAEEAQAALPDAGKAAAFPDGRKPVAALPYKGKRGIRVLRLKPSGEAAAAAAEEFRLEGKKRTKAASRSSRNGARQKAAAAAKGATGKQPARAKPKLEARYFEQPEAAGARPDSEQVGSAVKTSRGLRKFISNARFRLAKHGVGLRYAPDEAKPEFNVTTSEGAKITVYGMKAGKSKVYIFGDPRRFTSVYKRGSDESQSTRMFVSTEVLGSVLSSGSSKRRMLEALESSGAAVPESKLEPGKQFFDLESVKHAIGSGGLSSRTIAAAVEWAESKAKTNGRSSAGPFGRLSGAARGAAASASSKLKSYQMQYDNRYQASIHMVEPRSEKKKVIPNLVIASTGTIQSIGNDQIIEKSGGRDYYVIPGYAFKSIGYSAYRARKSITPRRDPLEISVSMPGSESVEVSKSLLDPDAFRIHGAAAATGLFRPQVAAEMRSPFSAEDPRAASLSSLRIASAAVSVPSWAKGSWARKALVPSFSAQAFGQLAGFAVPDASIAGLPLPRTPDGRQPWQAISQMPVWSGKAAAAAAASVTRPKPGKPGRGRGGKR